MFQNYLAAALRNLLRNRIYTAINVLGLAVGFAAAIFAALFVRNASTTNAWIPGGDRTYVVATTVVYQDGSPPEEVPMAYRDVAAWLVQDFPEVEAAVRLWDGPGGAAATATAVPGPGLATTMVRRGDILEVEENYNVGTADPGFFSVLSVSSVAGDLKLALDRPDGIVMTRKMARKYFGRDAPIGEAIEINQHPMRVAAVIEDWPSNTTLRAQRTLPQIYVSSLAPFSLLKKWDETHFGPATPKYELFGYASKTLVRLKPNASIGVLQKAMPQFVNAHKMKDILGDTSMRLIPLVGIDLASINNARDTKVRSQAYAAIHGAESIGILIILAAAINFVNGMTARASRRAVEVGVRKITGAARRQLIQQFLGESVLYALLGLVVAIGLVMASQPAFYRLIGRVIVFDPLRDPALSLAILGGTFAIGALAGLYPAFILSSLRPAKVLKAGGAQADGSNYVRRGLVTLQFAILIGLVVFAVSIYRQTNYAINEAFRYDKDQILEVFAGCIAPLETEIRKLPGVRAAGCGGPLFSYRLRTNTIAPNGGRQRVNMIPTDIGQFDVYGIKPVAGRLFSSGHSEDIAPANITVNPTVVINESAVKSFGFSSPVMAIGQTISWQRQPPEMTDDNRDIETMPFSPSLIIGVVPDFIRDVEDTVSPTIYYADPAFGDGFLDIKLTGDNIPETLKSIDHLWSQLGTPGWPINRFFLDGYIEDSYSDLVRQEQAMAVFCGVALFIAMLGLFGLSAFTADRRTKEIGVRKAMGAGRIDILRLLLWEFGKPILWGNVIAWPLAYFVARRWLEGFPNRVDLPLWIFLSAAFLALVVAVLTVAGHALLITRTQPASALRYE